MLEMLSIGTVAKIFGMTKQGIRMYAKKNLIIPIRHENNSYRYYPCNYVGHLCKVRYLQAMGLSLSEIADEIMTPDAQDMQNSLIQEKLSYQGWIQSLDERSDDLKQEIAYKQNLLQITERSRKEALQIPELLGTYRIETSEELLYWELSDTQNKMHMSDRKIIEAKQWVNLLPISRYAFLYPGGRLKGTEKQEGVSRGLIIHVQDAEKHNIVPSKFVKRLPAGKCFHTIIKTGVHDRATTGLLRNVLVSLEKEKLEIDGDILGLWMTNLIEEKINYKYYDIWVPVK